MKQKLVSFEVAKALKEAGYPQEYNEGIEHWYCIDGGIDTNLIDYPICSCPTYLDVWLWLWKEKGIYIDIQSSKLGTQMDIWDTKQNCIIGDNTIFYNDPEEAIEAAIEYLVDNDLIK